MLYAPGMTSSTCADFSVGLRERPAWAEWLEELVSSQEGLFPRSNTPPGHRGEPYLAAFADASLEVYCAALYVLWEVEGGVVFFCLLIAKVRLTALKGTTIQRGDLCAIVVMTHLLLLAALHLANPIHRISMNVHAFGLCYQCLGEVWLVLPALLAEQSQ